MQIETAKGIDDKDYKVYNGTWYHVETPDQVIQWIETFRASGSRIRLHYGDTVTGLDWGDIHDVTGRIGRSMGPIKIPLLIHSKRSFGGVGILTHCIVKIDYSNKKDRSKNGAPYQLKNYHTKD